MFENKSTAQEIIERLSSSYGVKSQRELAKALDIPPNNVSAWAQRGSVPGNSIIKCALDTGADLNWLVNGELAKASLKDRGGVEEGKALYNEIISNGGKPVLRRIMDAYGFTMQKQLCDLLDISSGTVSTWIRREYFPGDVVVTCAIDTGVSLQWLALGKDNHINQDILKKIITIPRVDIDTGELVESGEIVLDCAFLKKDTGNIKCIRKSNNLWFVDFNEITLGNGSWLIAIDGIHDIWNAVRLPGGNIKLSNNLLEFTCSTSEITCIGRVILKVEGC